MNNVEEVLVLLRYAEVILKLKKQNSFTNKFVYLEQVIKVHSAETSLHTTSTKKANKNREIWQHHVLNLDFVASSDDLSYAMHEWR